MYKFCNVIIWGFVVYIIEFVLNFNFYLEYEISGIDLVFKYVYLLIFYICIN